MKGDIMLEFLRSVDSWIWIVVILVLYMGFYIYRNVANYNKNRNAILDFQNKLEIGSRVVLSSGIHATVKEMNKQTATVEIAPKLEIIVERFSIVAFEKAVTLEEEKTDDKE